MPPLLAGGHRTWGAGVGNGGEGWQDATREDQDFVTKAAFGYSCSLGN